MSLEGKQVLSHTEMHMPRSRMTRTVSSWTFACAFPCGKGPAFLLVCLWFTNTNCCNLIKYGTYLLVCRRPDLTCVDSLTELCFNDKTSINSIIYKADAPLHMEQISHKFEAQMVLSSLYSSVCALEHLTGSS